MIEVKNLTKAYGNFVAVRTYRSRPSSGSILGFLGPNGAGKTTTMRIITGFMPATAGTVLIDGLDIFTQSLEARRKIGYLPENPPLYPDMRVEAYLRFVAKLRGVPRAEDRDGARARARRLRPDRHGASDLRPALEGLSPARRAGAGADSRSAGAGARRADHRPRPAPDSRNSRADSRPLRQAHGRALDAHPARGLADLRQGRDHRRRPRGARGIPEAACRRALRSKMFSWTAITKEQSRGRREAEETLEEVGAGHS